MKNTNWVLGIVLIVVLAVALLGGVGMMGLGGFGMMGPGMMSGYGGMMGGWSYNPIGAIASLVTWALVLGGIALLVVWVARDAGGVTSATRPDSAIEILKTRYARGEITKEQFDEMKKVLEV